MSDYDALLDHLCDQDKPLNLFQFNAAIDAIRALAKERDELRAENARFKEDDSEECHRVHKLWRDALTVNADLQRQLAELRERAERYDWLKQRATRREYNGVPAWIIEAVPFVVGDLSDAIDAYRSAK